MPFCLMHDYGKWSRLSSGKKHRTCKKCGRKKSKDANSWDRFLCSHRERRDRRRKVIVFTCKKCGRQREKVR